MNNKPSKSRRDCMKLCLSSLACLTLGKMSPPLYSKDNTGLWKWSREADFYAFDRGTLYCEICPNECIIRQGKTGDCKTRVNKNGKLYTVSYGNPCAVNIDPIEKKPLFHFLPGSKAFSIATAGCNLRCLNCQNWSISQVSPYDVKNYDLMPEELIKLVQKNKCESIAYTYSEPIVFYEYTYDSAVLARENGINNVLVTAGYINEKPLKKLCKVIDAANVDLKSFSDSIYKKLNGGRLKPILKSLEIFAEENVWLEITNLIVPNWTDDIGMIKKMCQWLVKNNLSHYPLHFSRFSPMYKLKNLPYTPVSTMIKARETALDSGMKYVYIGNAPGKGFESTFCHKCNKLLIKRRGYHILNNEIIDNKCPKCKTLIPGNWTK